MATFGKTAIGASRVPMSGDYKRGCRFNCPHSGATTSKVSAYLKGGGAASQKVKVVIYKDDYVRTKVAESGEVVVASGAAPAWVDFTLVTTLSAGDYWLTLITGTTTEQAEYYYDTNWWSYVLGNYDVYSDGGAATFGYGTTTYFRQISIYVTYSVVDLTAPEVHVTAPTEGEVVVGTKSVTATATDGVGVAGVQFKCDGVNIGAEDTGSPFSYSWDSTTVDDGSHVISAVARDDAGNTSTDEVTITVKNQIDYESPKSVVLLIESEHV